MTRRWIGSRVLRRPSARARDRLGRDLGDLADSPRRPAEVLERQGPQRDLADPEVGAPVDELEGLLGAAAMADARILEALGGRPSAGCRP